ncbi:MAG: hypothetical protein ACLPX5_05865 [Dissulfurispiraceae bacterium]
MKQFTLGVLIVLFGLILCPVPSYSGGYDMSGITHSSDFEKMKELVGSWQGTTDMGKGPQTFKVTYELTSAGNAVIEKLFVGLPDEMVSVYYDFNGKLNMTHYCSIGNQPHMELMNSGEKNMFFTLSKKNPNLVSENEDHMHSLNISFEGKDSITQSWSRYKKGEKQSDTVIKLTRTKP